uniref:SMC_N domain-containing protein n=1 Tax=Macrostomum lignano TaxID=282301 RepID=A0A1I8I363_9PLAT
MTDQADDPDHHARGGSDDERLETEQDLMNLAPLVIPPKPADLPMTGEEQGRARLMISQIVNRNFKSYAGERILGPFHQNFTAIVGPNGSGKSNVIDSMLFVFGYRASKIRSKKLSSLIHSSENFAAIDSCTVEIHFQRVVDREDGGYDIVEGSQFSVARTAFKDNASYYAVNGRRHEYKKVAELLMRVGIDLTHNRFLILQGEVEQISLMKPIAPNEHEEGLLEYLEDIIGSSRFKNPLTRIVRRIDALNDLRLEKVNQVKAVEKQKADLQGERDKALQYLRLCNQIVSKKNILFQIYRRECAATIDSMRGEQEQRQSELDAALAKLQEAKQQSKRKVEENKEIVKAYQEQQTIYTVTKEKFTALEVEDASLREEYKRMKAQGKKTVRLAEEEASKIEELKRAPRMRRSDWLSWLRNWSSWRSSEQTALNAIEAETKDLRAEKVVAERQLADLQKDANAKRSARDMARTELDILLSGQTRALQRLDAAKQDADGVERALAEKTAIRDRAAKETPEMQKSLERARRDEAALQQREAGLAEEARGLRVRVDEARRQLEQRSQSRVLQALLEQKKRGRFTGVRGRLGDLGAIDE